MCTFEPFEFPSYMKVRDVRNKLLQLRRHVQCRACILKPPHQGLLGSSPTRRNSLPLGLGTGAERSQTCGVPLFKASPSLKVLNSLLLVSLDALTLLAHDICKLRSRNLEIAQTYCTISRLGAQFPDSKNAQCNLKITQIPKLRGTFILLFSVTVVQLVGHMPGLAHWFQE